MPKTNKNFCFKYLLGMGMVSMAIPIFTSTETGGSGSRVSERTEYYTTAKQLLSSGADAGERLMTAYKVCPIIFLGPFLLCTIRV